MDLRNTFIRIKDECHSRAFQDHILSMGVKWASAENEVAWTSCPTLFINDDLILHYTPPNKNIYLLAPNKEILFENGVITFADDALVSELPDFSDAKVGDKVWHYRFGEGVIERVDGIDSEHPLLIRTGGDNYNWYTLSGKINESDINPTIYRSEPKIIAPPKPIRMKKINGHDVPEIHFQPIDNEYCYIPFLGIDCHDECCFTPSSKVDIWYSQNDMCYPYTEEGKAAAIAHAKALLDYKKD